MNFLDPDKAFLIFDKIWLFLLSEPKNIKYLVYLFSFSLSIFLIYHWFKIELQNKDEIGKWEKIFSLYRNYKFLTKEKDLYWAEIKRTFLQNPYQGLIYAKKFLYLILDNLGYSGSLKEKIEKLDPGIVSNLENFKKAIEITEIIEKENRKNELTQEEIRLVFHEIELGLSSLNIITEQDFLASPPK